MTSLNRFLRPKIYLGTNMTIINDTIDIGSSKLINLEDGTNSQDAITFSQLLNLKNFLNNSIQNTNVFLNLQKSSVTNIIF